MTKESLLAELKHEAINTRRLFQAIPEDVLEYRPNEFNWTIAELASHTSELYNWWPPTLHLDILDMSAYSYDKGDISSISSILAKLDENINKAINSLSDYPEEKLFENWSMQNKGKPLIEPMPRIQVIRSFLLNHLYHHRGELVAYLRAAGKEVPGLYGPSYEEQQSLKT